jgi:hypothetical protein
MNRFGFNTTVPEHWNKWWLAMWAISAPSLIVAAFHIPFVPWVVAAIGGFLVPEMFSILRRDDAYPPLTHAIRHFIPNWVAFPLIYFSLGAVGANWLGFARPLQLGALMGLLGWLTDHFSVTYAGSDPYPFTNRELRRRQPNDGEQATTKLPT